MRYRLESTHVELRDDGMPFNPGSEIELSDEEIENSNQYRYLLAEDRLVPIKSDKDILTSPGDHNIDEVLGVFEKSTPEQIKKAQQLEADGKKRKGILDFKVPEVPSQEANQ